MAFKARKILSSTNLFIFSRQNQVSQKSEELSPPSYWLYVWIATKFNPLSPLTAVCHRFISPMMTCSSGHTEKNSSARKWIDCCVIHSLIHFIQPFYSKMYLVFYSDMSFLTSPLGNLESCLRNLRTAMYVLFENSRTYSFLYIPRFLELTESVWKSFVVWWRVWQINDSLIKITLLNLASM